MPKLKNTVAVDWRDGKDKIYFFFKDTETYSRFDIAANGILPEYPKSVYGNWGEFAPHVKNLRFGFTGAGNGHAKDTLWLFYYQDNTPMVCEYSQDSDSVVSSKPVSQTKWAALHPHFDRIVGVRWISEPNQFRVLLRDNFVLDFNVLFNRLTKLSLQKAGWEKLEKYKDSLMTAVLDDTPAFHSTFYIFLTNGQYFRHQSIDALTGPFDVNEGNWPGLRSN
ncbi:hypothetical protein ASE98_21865 [Pseudomonas sp. Leaf48]|jgi:hypothetical protein|uniref:hypothetical protein n=1 Tax=unclassified Pseudomonas TaxID=196821 RepID=UPI0007271EBF|nr:MULTISPECIES: hypothetical protein [unclassified Pseudomonas]KQN52530.1 hypothetical protein ASE98_21865 [Pseudomonas sp. Leaf48]MBV7480018.1 hypothetical protein [Pseudomonas sp. PDM31]